MCSGRMALLLALFLSVCLFVAWPRASQNEYIPVMPESAESSRGPFPAWPWFVPVLPALIPVIRLWQRNRRLGNSLTFRQTVPVSYYRARIQSRRARQGLAPRFGKVWLLSARFVAWYTSNTYERERYMSFDKRQRRLAAVGRWVIAVLFIGAGCIVGRWALVANDFTEIVIGTAGFVCFVLAGIVWIALTRE